MFRPHTLYIRIRIVRKAVSYTHLGVRVYSKFSSGDPDASKSATALFLSCVFLVIVGTVLRSFFL